MILRNPQYQYYEEVPITIIVRIPHIFPRIIRGMYGIYMFLKEKAVFSFKFKAKKRVDLLHRSVAILCWFGVPHKK